jgi:inorganic pyrophosphatase
MPGKRYGLLSELEPIDEDGAINVVIETSRGARTKYNYDPELGAFIAKKILPLGMSFPFDFGFIPSTLGSDGDPLDVLVLVDEPVPTGAIVPSRFIGVIEAEQTERDGETTNNHRLVAVATATELFAEVRSFDDLPSSVMQQIEHFFISYNEQAGKKFEPTDRGNAKRAEALMRQGHQRFSKKKKKKK